MKEVVIFFKILIIAFLVVSCNKKEQSIPLNTTTNKDRDYYENLALTKGDTSAYYNLETYYIDSPIEGFLYTSLIMANKYDYHLAYENVYYCLTDYRHKKEFTELEDLDPITRKMALDYLKRGAEKGNKECKKILGNHYLEGKYIEKDTVKGKQLQEESER